MVITVGLDSSASSQIDINSAVNLSSTATAALGLDAVSAASFDDAADSLSIVEAALDTTSGFRASSVVAAVRARYDSSGNFESTAVGPGGFGKRIRQSTRRPLLNVCCRA